MTFYRLLSDRITMPEEAEPKPWYHFDLPEVKPIQAFGRVWKVWELNILWSLAFILYYLCLLYTSDAADE